MKISRDLGLGKRSVAVVIERFDDFGGDADDHLKPASRKDANWKSYKKYFINSSGKIVVTSDRNPRRGVNPIQHLLLRKPLGVFAASWHAVVWTEDAA
jgi:hypothetical protein